jgi:cation diffusion facilitator CzcD-associated flavoprotein CzcO
MERKECVVVGAGLAAAYRLTQEKRTILLRLQSRNSRTGLWKTLPMPTPYRGAQVKVVAQRSTLSNSHGRKSSSLEERMPSIGLVSGSLCDLS